MFSWDSRPARRPSARNLVRVSACSANPAYSSLIATSRSRTRSVARQTSLYPPAPILWCSSYRSLRMAQEVDTRLKLPLRYAHNQAGRLSRGSGAQPVRHLSAAGLPEQQYVTRSGKTGLKGRFAGTDDYGFRPSSGGAVRRFLFSVTVCTAACTALMVAPAAVLPDASPAAAASGGALAVRSGPALPGGGPSADPTLSVRSQLALRRDAVTGDRAYGLGTEDGRYPAMGFHTRGEMGGIWAPPIKLLDGIWFGINGQWIGPATQFTSGFGYARMALPTTGGIQITRTDFAPDGRRAVEIGLTL